MTPTHDNADSLRFPILIGDIGGTNARFALLLDAFAEPRHFPVCATADFSNIDEAIQLSVLDKTSIQPRSAVLAIAGPIDGDEIDMTNSDWVVRPKELIRDLGFDEIVVMNDFEAQALAVSAIPESGRTRIGTGSAHEGASRAVVGPGTGLGVAGLVRARRMWIPVAGEGGHVDFGPHNKREEALWPHLERVEGRVSAEQVLSGRGLVNLYRALCRVENVTPAFSDPAAVSEAALARSDPLARETVELFGLCLARFAGDMALVFMARGGVYIAGGIFKRILPALDPTSLRTAFEDKAPHRALLHDIPLFAITQPQAALAGLAAYARTPRFYGLETSGRRWPA